MKIAMHSGNLCERGVPKSIFNYATKLEQFFGHEIICFYDKNSHFNNQIGITKFEDRFPTHGYEVWSEVEDRIKSESIDLLYTQKMGNNDGQIAEVVPTVVHSVFQVHQPHGAVYAYISEWLSKKMPGNHPFVPYMVERIEPKTELRSILGIPSTALVIGRHGAYNQFDLDFVQDCVRDIASANKDVFFLFLNTQPFCEEMENIIHLPKTVDEQFIADFINACDAMLHARALGESFGLAVAEFLSHDKPVISFKGGTDQNHLLMLGEKGMWYTEADSLRELILNFERRSNGEYRATVEQFSAKNVMEKFHKVFLD